MSNLQNAMKTLGNDSNAIILLLCFTAGLVAILVIVFTIYKFTEERHVRRSGLEKVENYLEKGVIYNPPRYLGNGMIEYDVDACIVMQDDVRTYENRYDLVLVRTSSEEESSDEESMSDYSDTLVVWYMPLYNYLCEKYTIEFSIRFIACMI